MENTEASSPSVVSKQWTFLKETHFTQLNDITFVKVNHKILYNICIHLHSSHVHFHSQNFLHLIYYSTRGFWVSWCTKKHFFVQIYIFWIGPRPPIFSSSFTLGDDSTNKYFTQTQFTRVTESINIKKGYQKMYLIREE